MGVLTYTATRDVIVTHTVGLVYQIETAFQIIDEDSPETGSEHRMLDSSVEYELDNFSDLVLLKSDIVVEADKLLWREFFKSVGGREPLTVDLTGTIAAPGTNLNGILHKGRYRPVRTSDGVQTYTFTFTVKLT